MIKIKFPSREWKTVAWIIRPAGSYYADEYVTRSVYPGSRIVGSYSELRTGPGTISGTFALYRTTPLRWMLDLSGILLHHNAPPPIDLWQTFRRFPNKQVGLIPEYIRGCGGWICAGLQAFLKWKKSSQPAPCSPRRGVHLAGRKKGAAPPPQWRSGRLSAGPKRNPKPVGKSRV